jgi:transmembrane sensor
MGRSNIDEERLKRYFNGNTHGDALFAEETFTDDTNEKALKKILEKQFDELSQDNDLNENNLDHIFYRIHYNITSNNSENRVTKFQSFIKWNYRIAGIIIIPLIIFLGVYFYRTHSLNNNYWIEIKAPAWTRARFSLPDGTTGWLNSNSSIRYKGDFTNERLISLSGEAYFDVAKNPEKPFVVQTKEMMVKVLGTKFNIASYENEKEVEVVLEEGKLVFGDKLHKLSYTMKPDDLLIFNKDENVYTVKKILSMKYTSWKEGKLVFRNDPIDVVIRRLERWYNVVIINNIPASEDIRWRATFMDEDIEKVLDLMKRTLSINYRIEAPNVNAHDVYLKKKIIISQEILAN